jgi:nitrate reductase gamma subunit
MQPSGLEAFIGIVFMIGLLVAAIAGVAAIVGIAILVWRRVLQPSSCGVKTQPTIDA